MLKRNKKREGSEYMKNQERKENIRIWFPFLFVLIFCIFGMISAIPITVVAKEKNEVAKRIAIVQKEYPNNSKFNGWVSVGEKSGGGCNGLVMYTTLKVFHNAYTPGCSTYKHIGKSTSAKNVQALKNLFKKAKVGDVVRFRNGYTDTHFAIVLSVSSQGAYLYEANFGSRNKVKSNHLWPWSAMKNWPSGGATRVDIYRSKNYDKVKKKKSAKNYSKGKTIVVEGLKYIVTKNSGFGGEVKLVGVEEDYYTDNVIRIPSCIFADNTDEKGLNCNYSVKAEYGKSKNLSHQLTYKVVAIGKNALDNIEDGVNKVVIGTNVRSIEANAFKGISVIQIKSTNIGKVNKLAFAGTVENLVIKVPVSKYKNYKKLLAGKGQSANAVVTK